MNRYRRGRLYPPVRRRNTQHFDQRRPANERANTQMTSSDTGPMTCEVDDVEWVRYFTMHGAPRPAQARLISRRPPRPHRLPRHPQWPGPQGPLGPSQGSSRTSGGRPQPHSQDAAPHKILPRSSTPEGSPPKDLQTRTCSGTRQIQRLTIYARATCPWGTAEAHFTPMNGLRRRTGARPKVGRGRRQRTSRRRTQSHRSGWRRRAGHVPERPLGHDCAGVRHGGTGLLRQKMAELLGWTKMVQALDVWFSQGTGHNRSNFIAQPH